ncbi:phosphotransferase [Streptomyces harbinensis]|uniref:phosphotransferase n=1 Tax=Streptomyces harbinensis TaxID=1176198 RepID=UPI0037166BD5
MPGSSPRRLTAEVAARLLPVLEQQRDLDIDPEHRGSCYARDRLAGEWDHVRRAVAGSGGEGNRFVAALDALVASFGQVELPSEDLVHGDFRLDNVLLRSGRVAAVIDIAALGSGTRAFDYATLLTVDDIDRTGGNLTRAAGEQVAGPGLLAHCFALAALDLADFVRQRYRDFRGPRLFQQVRAQSDAAGDHLHATGASSPPGRSYPRASYVPSRSRWRRLGGVRGAAVGYRSVSVLQP